MGTSASAISSRIAQFTCHNTAEHDPTLIPELLWTTFEGCCEIQAVKRPPTLVAYFEIDRATCGGLLLVTATCIEAFNIFSGQRTCRLTSTFPIVAADYTPRSAFGPLIAFGSADGQVMLIDAISFELRKTLSVLQRDGTAPTGSTADAASISGEKRRWLTVIRIPMDNVLLAGCSDGVVYLLYLDSGVCVTHLPPPGFYRTNPCSDKVLCLQQNMAEDERKKISVPDPIKPHIAVSCIEFDRDRQLIFVGYVGSKQLTNQTATGQTTLLNLSPPIFSFSLEGHLQQRFEPTGGTVLHLCVITFADNIKYLLACTHSECHVWLLQLLLRNSSDATCTPFKSCNDSVNHPVLTVDFTKNLAPQVAMNDLGLCVGATYDTTDNVLFLLFELGHVALLSLNLPAQSEERGGTDRSVDYVFYKLLRLNPYPDPLVNVTSGLPDEDCDPLLAPTQYVSIGYDIRTQTILLGTNHAQVYVISDIFGRYLATQLQQDAQAKQFVQIMNEEPRNEQVTSGFTPTLYIGRRRSMVQPTIVALPKMLLPTWWFPEPRA